MQHTTYASPPRAPRDVPAGQCTGQVLGRPTPHGLLTEQAPTLRPSTTWR